jgi:hypothetical protein
MDGENPEAAANAEMPATDAALNDGLEDSEEEDGEKIPEEVH